MGKNLNRKRTERVRIIGKGPGNIGVKFWRWAGIWEKNIWGRGNCKCKGPEVETCLRRSWYREKPSAAGAEWVRRRVEGEEGGRRWGQVSQVLVGHGEDFGFGTEWNGNHGRDVSRKEIWFNLYVKRILWLLVLITGCVYVWAGGAEAETHEQRLLKQPS